MDQVLDRIRGEDGEVDLSQALQALGVSAEGLFASLLVGDVVHDSLQRSEPMLATRDHDGFVTEPDHPAAPSEQPVFGQERLSGEPSVLLLLHRPRPILGVDLPVPELRIGHPFLGREPEDGLDLRTDVGPRAGFTELGPVDDCGEPFDQRPEPALGLLELDLSRLELGPPGPLGLVELPKLLRIPEGLLITEVGRLLHDRQSR
jgi:hypothetical protein